MPRADRLIILDRDGVINQDSDDYVKSLQEFHPYPSAIHAIGRLCQAGWTVAVATNQSGIARGYYDEATLASMHEHLQAMVADAGGKLAHIAYCPHAPEDDCDCRKPRPGLLDQIGRALGMPTLQGSWMVGDKNVDLQVGEARGCRPVLVRSGKGERTLTKHPELAAPESRARIFDDLASFVDWLLDEQQAP
ncbi:D-glycero-beta-D-manno-heptose 1,7-bisphosphate 7-phosphatase [Halomonas salipaludis]|uniref:D,D-heptose 1,7-bisphosphate phosphatase n=1 Tax=Halomonas salipaludis TaxID=2032625 RepID=A0A2A2EZ71_9GAMM|nr:D-glycero-beta-D-manno-heptose 1,7-bisphosphate 7-phosphatase [Halomonas salipaludis]PAU77657.1 D-glycero-beta-D-manno-heptose-1,7-bisphosphate 7-phosphatase [Halomonas salipaludis]